MDLRKLIELVEVAAAPSACLDDARRTLGAVSRLEAWLTSARYSATRVISELAVVDKSISPEHEIARISHATLGEANRSLERATMLETLPEVRHALQHGELSPAHVEVLRSITARLSPLQLAALGDADRELAAAAAALPPDKFAKKVKHVVERTAEANDAVRRFDRQKAAAFLRHWIDPTSGMWHLRGEFDPLTGARLEGRIRNQLEAMFHGPTMPTPHLGDPGAQQDHLRSRAFVTLLDRGAQVPIAAPDPCAPSESSASLARSENPGSPHPQVSPASRPPRAEIVIVVDHDTLRSGRHDRSIVSVNNGAELPIETIRQIALHADVYVAEVDRHGLPLNLGLVARTAGKYQRIALRVLYDSCAVPGCNVRFDYCQPHHLHHYESGGPTDFDNLVPLCSRHHHRIHDDGWQVEVDDRRNITVTLPDNSRMCSPPKIPWVTAC